MSHSIYSFHAFLLHLDRGPVFTSLSFEFTNLKLSSSRVRKKSSGGLSSFASLTAEMSHDMLELVIRPLAHKVMDLTLGRYQVLEHHRHRVPEFLAMCQDDVEGFLVAFSKMDLERLARDARLEAKTSGKTQYKVPGEQSAQSSTVSNAGVSELTPQEAEDEQEAQRLQSLTPEAYIEELKIITQRQKATEMFLRSTLSDLLAEMDVKNTALDTQQGQITHRNTRLATLREMFLRENRQLRDIIRQFREKGKCDLPDPVLFDWDAQETFSGKGRAADALSSGQQKLEDPVVLMKQQCDKEKEAVERALTKQLDEQRFSLRSVEVQLTNANRIRAEQGALVAKLQARVAALEAAEPSGASSPLHQSAAAPVSTAALVATEAAIEEAPLATSTGSPSSDLAPPASSNTQRATVDCGVQVDLIKMAEVPLPVQLSANDNNASAVVAVVPSSVFSLQVDPTLQDVLMARQPSPDGLGAGVHRSYSATHTPTSNFDSPLSGSKQTSTGNTKKSSSVVTTVAEGSAKSDSLSSGNQSKKRNGATKSAIDAAAPRDGASPWTDEALDPVGTGMAAAASMETGAATPSQLENVKLHKAASQQSSVTSAHLNTAGKDSSAPSKRGGVTDAELQRLRAENASLRAANASAVVGSSETANSSELLKQLKEELHKKTRLLDERSSELEQLKTETVRWFDAYKRGVPPANLKAVNALTKRAPHQKVVAAGSSLGPPPHDPNVTPSEDLIVNYAAAAELQRAVFKAEELESAYRTLSWKLIRVGFDNFQVLCGHLLDIKQAEKTRDVSLLCAQQRQLDILDHQAQLRVGRLRQQRAHTRAEANRMWDQVLRFARGVCRLESLEDVELTTPRYYLQSERQRPAPPIATVASNSDAGSVYFRAMSSAAATYTVQHGLHQTAAAAGGSASLFSSIPMRGVSAVSPATLLPQRPPSAPLRGNSTAGVCVNRLRSAVTRPTSAIMLRRAVDGNDSPSRTDRAAASTRTFNPSALAGMSASDRRSLVAAAVSRDKCDAAREKKALAEERYAFRASACATIPPDMARDEPPLIHMAKLTGRFEVV